MDYSLGYFESFDDVLNKATFREEQFWSDIRKTGYHQLDREIGGFRAGDLVVIGSQCNWMIPSLFLQMIETVAITEQRPVLHIRVGKDVRNLVGAWFKRIEIDPSWQEGCKNSGSLDTEKLSGLAGVPLYILDAHGYSWQNLVNAIDSCAKSIKPIGLIVIDGIDHLDIWSGLPEISLAARWATVSGELKSLALRHQSPVIVDSRINSWEQDGSKVELATLRHFPYDSALASSADHVLVLESVDGVISGEPADLYSVYSKSGLQCRWMPLRYEHERDRWVEIIER